MVGERAVLGSGIVILFAAPDAVTCFGPQEQKMQPLATVLFSSLLLTVPPGEGQHELPDPPERVRGRERTRGDPWRPQVGSAAPACRHGGKGHCWLCRLLRVVEALAGGCFVSGIGPLHSSGAHLWFLQVALHAGE